MQLEASVGVRQFVANGQSNLQADLEWRLVGVGVATRSDDVSQLPVGTG